VSPGVAIGASTLWYRRQARVLGRAQGPSDSHHERDGEEEEEGDRGEGDEDRIGLAELKDERSGSWEAEESKPQSRARSPRP